MGGAPRALVRRAFQFSAFDKMITKPIAILSHLGDREFLAQIEAVDRTRIALYEQGAAVEQHTYDYEPESDRLTPHRTKEEADDYRYFPEPDLVPVQPEPALVARLRGLELTVYSLPQKPYRNAELVEQLGGAYVSSQEQTLAEVSVERGPFDLIFDATGFSPIVWEAAEVLGKNGVLVLASITGGERKAEINSDRINQSFVLGNKVMVGTVNAAPADFRSGVDDLIKAEAIYPGWLKQLLTTPIAGLENYEQMIRELTENRDAIKVYVEVASNGSNG